MFTRNLNFEITHICKEKKQLKKIQQKIHFGKFWMVGYGVVLFYLYYFLTTCNKISFLTPMNSFFNK